MLTSSETYIVIVREEMKLNVMVQGCSLAKAFESVEQPAL